MKFTLLLFSFCLAYTANAQKQLFKGTIGPYPIVLQLDRYDDTSAIINYFYEHKRKNITLEGSINKKGHISVICYRNYDEKITAQSEQLELDKTNGGYTGKWTGNKKNLPVLLTTLNPASVKNPFSGDPDIQKMLKEEPLDYVRTAGMQLIKDSTNEKNGIYLDWYHEKYSRIYFPRLRKTSMNAAFDQVNRQLAGIQVNEANALLTCTSHRGETEYDQSIDHVFVTDYLFSINVITSYDCGGAHPDFGATGFNFDLATGKLLALDDVIRFGKKPAKDEDDHYHYRDSVFVPHLLTILKKLYPNRMKKPKSEDECDYSDPGIWSYPNWHFTASGLYIGAYFARYMRSCDNPEWSIIPYSVVRKYLYAQIELPK